MIFSLVSPAALLCFTVVSVVACIIHKISGSRQRVPLTFVGLVAAALYFGSDPYGEPFPGALTFIAWVSTFLQVMFAAAAYWIRDLNKGHIE